MKWLVSLFGASVALILMALMVLGICLGTFLWPYTINSWLVYCNRPAVIVWWHGLLIGICPIIGKFTLPAAVITWIAMLFIG